MITKAVEILKSTKSLFVLTGAGISAESGIPTFRGAQGLWKNYSATELATPQAFEKDPALVWEWYQWRQDLISNAKPNPAHYALAELEKIIPHFLLLTQNVDGLHQRAGSKNILELHGNIFRTRCLQCNKITAYKAPEKISNEILPRCSCQGLLRPDVVWFGESIPQTIWQESLDFLKEADTALICGTSGVVWPAAAIPEIARQSNTRTIEINLEPTPVSSIVDLSINEKAGEVLKQLITALNQ
ncbi:MAG: NAD-dependent deacylase [bacterium]